MCALGEEGSADDFRRKHLNVSFTAMALAIAVKEAFAELFSKSDRIPFQKATVLFFSENVSSLSRNQERRR